MGSSPAPDSDLEEPHSRPAASLEERLAAACRLDWRFLLPEPDPTSIRYLGPAGDPLSRALRTAGIQVLSDPPAEAETPPEKAETAPAESASPTVHDLVVLPAPDAARLRAAKLLVRPGGWLYVECRGLFGGGLSRPASAAPAVAWALRGMGFQAVELQWHWPDMERTTRIMPLGRARPRMALEPAMIEPRGRMARGAIGVLASLGILGWIAPAVSVLARRAGGSGGGGGLLETLLADPGRWGLGGSAVPVRAADADWVLLTPRFHASRHAILLVTSRGSVDPTFVAKVARLPGDGTALDHAAATIRALAAEAGPAASVAPRLLATGAFAGRPMLVETAVAGRPLAPGLIRRDPIQHSRVVLDWLLRLPSAVPGQARPDDGGETGRADWVGELVEPGLRALEALEAPAAGPLQALVDAVRRTLAPAAAIDPGRVFEHGDLGHPNLLLDRHGRLGVIDWELGRRDGLPLHDLVFFLTYAAGAVKRARIPADHAAAFESAFLRADGWARPLVREYVRARGLPAELVAPLVIAAWARYLGGLPERIGGEQAEPEGRRGRERLPGSREGHISVRRQENTTWVAEHRYAAVLREALAGYGRLAGLGQGT